MNETLTPAQLLAKRFPFKPTSGQQDFFERMNVFVSRSEHEHYRDCFLLKGYAGTGKTTLISTLIKVLPKFGFKSVLLAPTGRAAKVMANYSKRMAQTIHRKIYRQIADANSGNLVFQRQKNYHEDTVFIVDEASMISDDAEIGMNGLLADLVDFVFENAGNRLILVGDVAQLPPVGKDISPALDKGYLERQFDMVVVEQELLEVMRQDERSGILLNATNLRGVLNERNPQISLDVRKYRDIYKMTGDRLEDGIRYCYDKYGRENTIIITRSNKMAVQYNQYIRRAINQCEEELDTGDMLMIVKNNYSVLDDDSPAGFLANGDFVEVLKIRKREEMHGLKFATVTMRLVDLEEQPEFESKIILDTLYSPQPSLGRDENRQLYENVQKDYFYIKTKKERSEAIRRDPYLNALQVKFAYALTCHKAQGGQWPAVFVDQGYLPDGQVNQDFVRWLYTAITRATDEAFLMNFMPQFFQ
ncbi:ATP-binding domain-containing protein [Larkinella harenae]